MYLVLVSIIVMLVDQLTKYYVVEHFTLGESLPVLPNIFHLTYILNPGAAFGMFAGNRWILVLIAIVAVGIPVLP